MGLKQLLWIALLATTGIALTTLAQTAKTTTRAKTPTSKIHKNPVQQLPFATRET